MRLTEIEINSYNVLKNNIVTFDRKSIFPQGSQIIGIIGANGSGKTTFCSAISYAFQSIFTLTKIDFDIRIAFEYRGEHKSIHINNNEVELLVKGELYYDFILGKKLRKSVREEHSKMVSEFWGERIILSTFETNSEYPNKKPYNYIGHDPIKKFDIGKLYEKNRYGFPSITNGLIRFIDNRRKRDIANDFFDLMGFRISGNIELKLSSQIIGSPELSVYDEEYLSGDMNESAYYNPVKHNIAKRNEVEYDLSFLLSNETVIEHHNETQIISFETALYIANKYPDYMGRYIFLNGLGLYKDDQELLFEDLSSGEKFLIMRYISILSGIEEDSIIIVEEPENHLNPKWREIIIPALHKVATDFNSVLIFTTHDHRIIRYIDNNSVIKITDGIIEKVNTPTLLCDEFDFEEINGGVIPFIFRDLRQSYNNMGRDEKALLLNAMCEVEEKVTLRKEFLKIDAKNN